MSKILRARKWHPLNHPSKRRQVGDGAKSSSGVVPRGSGQMPPPECKMAPGSLGGAEWDARHRRPWGGGTAHGDSSGDTGSCEIRLREGMAPPVAPGVSDSRLSPDSEPGDWAVGPGKAPSP